ncbi:DUF1120 domain-containing protein [Serratia marcescens]|uniref:DUF1120 domain-containing protein n=1 Tax=Serratia marcescens TaxID=615 RepID=UPI0009F64706|nr:DUF1120 domain-containing protein [Serratia marcescens]OQV35956.1 hypothetical protein BV901_10275 [Serratia nematodiphila]WGL77984.1 DUF1120 domain-containing protein [Serratia marcescens]
MKTTLVTVTAISAMLFSVGSLAVTPSAEIKVTGELIAPKCEIDSPEMTFDYGDKINHKLINDSAPVSLGMARAVTLTVNCDSETSVTFGVTDNRLGTASVSGSKYFGLGNINGTGKLGYYEINATRPKVDGKTTSLFVTSNGTIPTPLYSLLLEHGKRSGWAYQWDSTLAIGQTFSLDVLPEAFLAKRGDMHGGVSDDTVLDGSATLEFGFGL